MAKIIIYVVAGAALLAATVLGQQEVSPNCLGCLCEASTNCNASMACVTPYANGYFCGAFLISRAYWVDAGQPVLTNDNPDKNGAFENCVLDLECAAHAVKGYMQKFATDCNNDGVIDCQDYGYLHKLGGYGCRDPSLVKTEYWTRFQQCLAVVNAAN